MNTFLKHLNKKGFTIVELLIVIVVIGILASIAIVSYSGIQKQAIDKSVLSDIDGVSAEVTRFGINNNGVYGTATAWYSPSGANVNIKFIPTKGNIIDVNTSTSDYCIRAYNPSSATYKTLATAATKESSPGACASIGSSALAQADSPAPGWNLVTISANGSTICGTYTNSQLYCWGKNSNGQLGNASNANSNVPVAVSTSGVLSGKTIKGLSLSATWSCAIASDDLPYCWGVNFSGQLGNGSTTSSNIPVAVTMSGALSGKTVKSIKTVSNNTCVIASDDLPYCWGYNGSGQLGNGTTVDSSVPVAVNRSGVLSGKTISYIDTNNNTTCVITSDNLSYCWGNNSAGQLGNGSTTNTNIPVAVATSGVLNGKTVKSLSMNNLGACVIASDNLPYCWGDNTYGQLGNNTFVNSLVPVAVTTSGALSGKTVKSIDVSANKCVIASDDLPYCWGSNVSGQLGNGSTATSPVPVAVATTGVLSGKTIIKMKVFGNTCVIASDNQAYCAGVNASGQLGNGSTTNSSVPVAVATSGVLSGKSIKDLLMNASISCALTTDAGLYCWGFGGSGMLGNGSNSSSLFPVKVNAPY